jgi:hypothetical protein
MPRSDPAVLGGATRLPRALLGEFLPSPQLLVGRLAASTVAIYTWDCATYVAFCGYDSAVVLAPETLQRWRTHLVADTGLSPHTINRMLESVKIWGLPRQITAR